MTGHLPYEEQLQQQWIDLPLPDADMAWADMKRRLDEDDERRVLPFWLRGCAGWAILALLVTGLAWWIIRPEKWFTKSKQNEPVGSSDTASKLQQKSNDSSGSYIDSNQLKIKPDTTDKIKDGGSFADTTTVISQPPVTKDNANQKIKTTVNNKPIVNTTVISGNKKTKNKNRNNNSEEDSTANPKPQTINTNKPNKKPPADSAAFNKPPIKNKIDTTTTITQQPVQIKGSDTIAKKKIDTVAKKTDEIKKPAESAKKDSTKKSKFEFSAGLGLQQQLPVDSQKWVPYSGQDRKFSLGDYIPAVYFRITRPNKWFFQTEFRYGAPQYVKEVLFRADTIATTPSSPYRITNFDRVKKTYYHQLPLTFNYFIVKNWSIGAGMQWNKFHKAIIERSPLYHNNFTGIDSFGLKPILTLKKDSASEFTKSYWQVLAETRYQWKRFSFGARYTFGLKPYLNFALPNGIPMEEKNSSLQIFLQFQLWRSKSGKK